MVGNPCLTEYFAWLWLYAVLTHLAVVLYATALAKVGLLGKFGHALFVVSARLRPSWRNPTLARAFYPFMIPAVPFLRPYFIGVSLARRAGDPAS
jgi:hypothetical protein